MKRSEVLSTARLAGQVERYHTWPVHRRQSVGEHTWQVMVLYWRLFGPLSPAASTYLIWHDAGELATGDLPFPVKAQNPAVKVRFDELEHRAVIEMGGPDTDLQLPPAQDLIRCKVCDLLEMWEFGRTELAMGNTYAQPIVDDTLRAVWELAPKLPETDRERVRAYVSAGGGLLCA